MNLKVLTLNPSPVEKVEILNLIAHSFLEDRKITGTGELISAV
ncbi:hypothetical protein [Nostoc sp.]